MGSCRDPHHVRVDTTILQGTWLFLLERQFQSPSLGLNVQVGKSRCRSFGWSRLYLNCRQWHDPINPIVSYQDSHCCTYDSRTALYTRVIIRPVLLALPRRARALRSLSAPRSVNVQRAHQRLGILGRCNPSKFSLRGYSAFRP